MAMSRMGMCGGWFADDVDGKCCDNNPELTGYGRDAKTFHPSRLAHLRIHDWNIHDLHTYA